MQPPNFTAYLLGSLEPVASLFSSTLQPIFPAMNNQQLYAELNSLRCLGFIDIANEKVKSWSLTNEGARYLETGTPQWRVYEAVLTQAGDKDKIQALLKETYQIGLGKAIKDKAIAVQGAKIVRLKEDYKDEVREQLNRVRNNQMKVQGQQGVLPADGALAELKKRKLVEERQETNYIITKGPNFSTTKTQLKTTLTSQMIAQDSWDQFQFKKFNPTARGAELEGGNLHPLMKMKQRFVEVLIGMGFDEMATDQYVEASFWNFDALFQPQAHPARDAHDTFFVSHPKQSTVDDHDYFAQVRKIHEKGGFGSVGYDYEWDEKEAYKNLLRTHTTAVSSRTLRKIAKELKINGGTQQFKPRKFFSIDRVFRNQNLDQTHLAQFHQVQGFIVDYGLGLNHLIGVLREFYKKIGIEKIWLKPTYNPYTEPSMEIFGLHPTLNRRVQIGNSGLFRPQMLRPMGFPQGVSVIAWGLSLERPTMIQFGINNIRQLFGDGVSLKKVKECPIYCM